MKIYSTLLFNVRLQCFVMNWKITFSLSLVMKIESKLKLQKLRQSPKTPFPQGGWRVTACSPTDFIKELAQNFKEVTCDHSLGWSQVFTMFYKCLLCKGVLPRVPDAPNPPKTDRIFSYLFVNLHKTANKQQQKMPKNTLKVSWFISRNAPKFD